MNNAALGGVDFEVTKPIDQCGRSIGLGEGQFQRQSRR